MVETIIAVRNLAKTFDGDIHLVRGISFDIKEGDFFTLLGPKERENQQRCKC